MKIPFERTVASAYRFAFANILSVFGVAWFPYLLLAAAVSGVAYLYAPQVLLVMHAMQAKAKPDPAQLQALLAAVAPVYVIILPAALITSAIVTVGNTRKALGLHPGPVFFFFSLGSQVWLLIAAYILVVILFYGLAIACGVVGVTISVLAQHNAPRLALPATILWGLIAACFCIYAVVRTIFFLPAIVVAQDRIALWRSWRLGRGNFWRIVGIGLLMTIPAALATSILTSTVVQIFLGPSFGLPTAANMSAEGQAVARTMLSAFAKAAPYYVAIQFVGMAMMNGLNAGAIASAYRSVTEGDIASPALKGSA